MNSNLKKNSIQQAPPPAADQMTTTSTTSMRNTPPPSQPQLFHPPDEDACITFDTAVWRKEYSYRGQPYRCLNHQGGIIGYVKVRVVAARELGDKTNGRNRDISPCVQVRFHDSAMKTAIAPHNRDPTWRKEEMIFQIDKGCTHGDGLPIFGFIEVFDMTSNFASSLIKSNNSLGRGRVDITPLLKGEEDHAVMDVWIDLATAGQVHLIIEYEPHGEDPQVNDIVFLEAFARQPRSLILPPYEPFVVRAISGNHLLLSFYTESRARGSSSSAPPPPSAAASHDPAIIKKWEGQVKVHRNNVFVLERQSLMDDVYNLALRPADIILGTTPGQWVVKQVKPLTNYSKLLLTPAIITFQVAVGAARIAARSALAGVSSAANTAVGGQNHRF